MLSRRPASNMQSSRVLGSCPVPQLQRNLMSCSARLKAHAALSIRSQSIRPPEVVLPSQRRCASICTHAQPRSSSSSTSDRQTLLPSFQHQRQPPAPRSKGRSTIEGRSTWALQHSSTSSSTTASTAAATSKVAVTTFEELAAAVKAKRKHPRPLTIDLGGQTLVCQKDGQTLSVGGRKHIIVTNGSLVLPADCSFMVEGGAKLELIGLNITATGLGAEDGPKQRNLRPVVFATSRGCHLVLNSCSITWRRSELDLAKPPIAVCLRNGAQADVRSCLFDGMDCGVHATGSGTQASLDTTVSINCRWSGFQADDGARLHAHHCSAFGNTWFGFAGGHESTVVHLVQCRSDRNKAGIYALRGAKLVVEECVAEANQWFDVGEFEGPPKSRV